MWTYIEEKNLDTYLDKYESLREIFSGLILCETENKLFLPRLFYKNFSSKEICTIGKETKIEPENINIKFTGKLRPEQIEIVNHILKLYDQQNKNINGIIKARPGIGKSILSIYLAVKLGLKTCIVVDNDGLLKQWVKAIHSFTNLEESQIGLMQGKFFETALDKPICVAMVQTLLSKIKNSFPKSFRQVDDARFGLVIFDEVHATSSAPKFAQASLFFRTENILGLSATPFQTGVAEILMRNTVGETIYETTTYELKPRFILHYYDSQLSSTYSRKLAFIKDYIRRKAFYNSIIIKSEEYLNLIIHLIKQRGEEGHTSIVLCFTKAQVKLISETLERENISHRRYYGDEKEALDKENVKLVIATYAYCGKGFDFEGLSNLILATSLAGKKSLIQVIGRILRLHPDKLSPVVDDLIDLAFVSMTLPDAKLKKSIVTTEFKCDIEEIRHDIE